MRFSSELAVVLLALAVRGGVLMLPGALTEDPDGYRALAENVVAHGCFGRGDVPTAYRPPLYPLVLAPAVALGPNGSTAIRVLHLALGVATVWLTYRLGQSWGLGRWALVAAALVACDPILLAQSRLVMTETLATFLAVASLLALTAAARRPTVGRSALAGAALGAAALCRPTFLVPLAVAAVVLPGLARPWSQRFKTLAGFAVAAAVVLAPWAVRNQVRFGRPIVATTHGGYTLLLGNNPWFYEYLREGCWGTAWDPTAFHEHWAARASLDTPADELRTDRLAYTEAWETIGNQPGMFAYSCLVRAGRLWGPLPHRTEADESPTHAAARYAVGAWYLAEFVLALVGLIATHRAAGLVLPHRAARLVPALGRRRHKAGGSLNAGGSSKIGRPFSWSWGVILVVAFTAVHAFYWSNLRMRAPLMQVVTLAAAAGVGRLVRTGRRRKSLGEKQFDHTPEP